MPPTSPRDRAVRFVVALGVVSLFADATYEGARSILGPYLATLGAGAFAVAVVSGAGELVGYLLRLVAGYLADRWRRPWLLIGSGYGLNQLAVPLLAAAPTWPVAAGLVVTERTGKALRTPARDAVLAAAAAPIGGGRAFGVHEALDQAGALVGPLAVAGLLLWLGSERTALAFLALPAALCLASLLIARRWQPGDATPREPRPPAATGRFAPGFPLYLAGAACLGFGFADFPLLAYHLEQEAVVGLAAVPALYALAMGIDALAALAAGELFDRLGLATTSLAGLAAALVPALVFLGGTGTAVIGIALWGVAMGIQESTLRAGVAKLAAPERRATAFGAFHAVFGIAWFAGSAVIGALYSIDRPAAAAFAAAAAGAAVPLLILAGRQARGYVAHS